MSVMGDFDRLIDHCEQRGIRLPAVIMSRATRRALRDEIADEVGTSIVRDAEAGRAPQYRGIEIHVGDDIPDGRIEGL